MSYYINREIDGSFDDIVTKVREALAKQGFGILTEIDVKATFREKLDVDFQNYIILGACNPPFAHKALTAEDKIGLLLPCNVIVQDKPDGKIEIAAIDPVVSMMAVENDEINPIAEEIRGKLQAVIDSL